MNKKVFLLYILAFLGVIIILYVESFKVLKNIMIKPIGTINGTEFDYWSLSHFLLYTILGMVCPDKYLFFLSVSFVWELFEDFHAFDSIFLNCSRKSMFTGWWCSMTDDSWISKYEDILVNMMGYMLGNFIRAQYI